MDPRYQMTLKREKKPSQQKHTEQKNRIEGRKKRTHSLSTENLLHNRDAIRGRFTAPRPGPRENIAALKGERDRLGLDEGGSGKAHVCEGAQEAGVQEVRERGECGLGVHEMSGGHEIY